MTTPADEGPPTSTLGHTATMSKVQPVRLLVVDGPDRGKERLVTEGTATLGTHEACELRLTDSGVSRKHASIELLGTRVRVKDLNSKNGTRYLGARVEGLELPLGATIELGSSRVALLPALGSALMSDRDQLGGLIGRAPSMRRLFAQIEQVAPTDAAVLIHGQTGSGKEGVARAIHALSPRAHGPFKVFDCGTVQPELLQSALFGHAKGAFTGAVKDQGGALEAANAGVLFFDEVAELPLDLQPALLRALETKSFTRVGDGKTRKSDFRVLAATHVDLVEATQKGRFRLDLYYRIAALVLEVPPLKDRVDDIALLAHRFAAEAGAKEPLSASTLAALTARTYPGNVRELKNVVERVVAMGAETALPGGATAPLKAEDFHSTREKAIAAFEKSYLSALLERHGGNASAAAREAGIARSYLYKLLDAHGLKK
ncbi:MAG: sigma 54-dependent Fis family transcriptional regulator [Archangiaceae bacterium]|nr:sigma 54-dependent Fis family transcriptional regulator [Archangiaceae bacterium]